MTAGRVVDGGFGDSDSDSDSDSSSATKSRGFSDSSEAASKWETLVEANKLEVANTTQLDQAVRGGEVLQLTSSLASQLSQEFAMEKTVDRAAVELSYEWKQIEGAEATLADPSQPELTMEAPKLFAAEDLVFEVRVSDGKNEITERVVVTVDPVETQPPAVLGADGKGGGRAGARRCLRCAEIAMGTREAVDRPVYVLQGSPEQRQPRLITGPGGDKLLGTFGTDRQGAVFQDPPGSFLHPDPIRARVRGTLGFRNRRTHLGAGATVSSQDTTRGLPDNRDGSRVLGRDSHDEGITHRTRLDSVLESRSGRLDGLDQHV